MERKAGTERPAWGAAPRCPHTPSRESPSRGRPHPGAAAHEARRGRREVAGRSGRRGVRYSPARTSWPPSRAGGDGGAGGSGAGRLRVRAARRSQRRRGVPLSGRPWVLRAPGGRTVRRLQPTQRMRLACHTPPPGSSAGAVLKARTTDPGIFFCRPNEAQRLGHHPLPTFHFARHFQSHHLLFAHPVLEIRTLTPHVAQPRVLGACPVVWPGSQALCMSAEQGS